ncbi:MAG: PAS domain S-box protein [Cyanobacteria bacterium P01_F01_bin.86]
MVARTTDLTPLEPESAFAKRCKAAIVRNPLVVSSETTVQDAIAQMSAVRSRCKVTAIMQDEPDDLHLGARSSCVIVTEDERVIGILTERDVVHLGAQQLPLDHLKIQEVMGDRVITMPEAELTDLFYAVNLLLQHHIRHLPILDEQNHLVGLVTHESLRQIFQPMDLLRLRLVEEVMTRIVICADPHSSMLHIAQRMAQHRVSCIVLTETSGSDTALSQIPVGILTERDLVQFQALGLSLENCTAQTMMSTPVFAIPQEESLWSVHLLMAERRINRLVVTGERGELLGIVTQTSLLQALNPLELYKLAEILEAKVARLEAEKVVLLETRATTLEQEIETRTNELQAKANREKLLSELATQIRTSLDLQTILDTTVEQVRQVLGCDRVTVWQFVENWQSLVVAESTDSPLSFMGEQIQDTCLQSYTDIYTQGRIRIVSDIHTTDMTDCHRKLLMRLQIRAKVLVPLLCGGELWGLLNVTESQHARDWQPEEVDLLQALSVQLAIALQQATVYQKAQAELAERKKTEAALQVSENRFRAIFDNMFQFISLLAPDGTLLEANQTALTAGGITLEDVVGRPFWETPWWQISPVIQAQLRQAIAQAAQGALVHYEVEILGAHHIPIPIDFSLRSIVDETGQVVSLMATGFLLTRTKRLEVEREQAFANLHQSEQRYASLTAAVPVGIFRTDVMGRCIYVNDRWCQIAGLPPIAARGQKWTKSLHPDDRDRINAAWHQAVQANRLSQLEYRFQRPDGTVTWVYGQMVAEQDSNGQITGYVGTIIDISDRKAAEAALAVQRDANQLIADINSQFVDIRRQTFDAAIHQTLERLSQFLHVDTSYCFHLDPHGHTLSMTHEWCAPGMTHRQKQAQNIPWRAFPWSYERLLQHQLGLAIPNVDELPAEAAEDQTSWQRFHIKAVLAIPLIQGGIATGFIGLAYCHQPHEWEDSIVDLLWQIGGTIASAQARIQAEHQLYLNEERLRLPLGAANQGLYDLNLQTDEFVVSPEYALMLGYDATNFRETTATWRDRMHPEDRDRATQAYQAYAAGETAEYRAEFRLQTQQGDWIWILSVGQFVEWDVAHQPLRLLGTHTDISDRKQTELALRNSEAQSRAILNAIPDLILLVGADGTYRNFVTPYRAFALLENGENHAGLSLFDVLPAEIAEQQFYCVQQALQTGKLQVFEQQLEIKGRLQDEEVRVIKSSENSALLMIRDISDRKRTEAERLQAEQIRQELTLLEQILDIVLGGYWDWDIPNHQKYLSPGFKRMFGYADQELPNTPDSWQTLIFPEDLPEVLDCFKRHVQSRGQVPYYNEVRYRHKDGSTVWVICSGQVIDWDEAGNPLRMIGCHIDISARKQAEQALMMSETRFRTLIDSLPFAIWVRDADNRLVLQNPADIARFGNMLGSTLDTLDIPPEVVDLYWDIKQQRRIGESIAQETTEMVAGQERSFLRIETVIPDNLTDGRGTLGVAIDITTQKQAEEQIRRYSDQLEASNRELEAFAYSVSHDLRSPLRIIEGFSRALLEDYGHTFNEEAKDYCERIRKNIARMGNLIDDLLSLSRVARSAIQYTKVNLSAIAHEVITDLQSSGQDRQVEWVIVPNAMVWGDATLMRVVLMNLLENAWKFTSHQPTAHIEFGIMHQDNHLTYFVRDDGAGFDMAYAQQLFGAFQRLHSTQVFPGTGIGLATVQRAIHRHRGRVWAEGTVDQGATVYFTIPTVQPKSSQEDLSS